jgi:dUTP pyrophosphatase
MNFDLETMKAKALLVADPNSGYTQKDFNEEFGGTGGINVSADQDNYKLKLKFSNKSSNQDPEYATDGASGFDLRANLDTPMVIKPSEYKLIKTGLYFEIPEHMEITIRSRSGLAYKHGIAVLNGIGTIDSDYRGELGVLLINHGKEEFTIQHGDRIAQGVLSSVIGKSLINFVKVGEISDNTERSTGGYGSTGTK